MSNEFDNLEQGKTLELPPLSIKGIADGSAMTVKILGELGTKPDIDHKTGEQRKDKNGNPQNITTVHAVTKDGQEGSMVCPFIIHRALEEAGAIIGRFFKFTKIKSETGKTTMWRVDELLPKKPAAK